jgi:DNA-binding transcriptional LysR family regulator
MTDVRFTVAFPPGVTVGKWTRAFAERHPDVILAVVRTSPAEQKAVLTSGEADMCFVRLPIDRSGLHVIPLYDENIVVALNEEHLLTLEKTVSLAELEAERVLEGEPDEAMFRAVADGAGVAVVPQSIAKVYRRRDVTVLQITDAEPSRIALAWPQAASNPLVDEFVGIVRGRTAQSSRTPEVQAAEAAAAVEARAARNAASAKAAKDSKAAKAAGGSKSSARSGGRAGAQAKARARSAQRANKKPGRRR